MLREMEDAHVHEHMQAMLFLREVCAAVVQEHIVKTHADSAR